MIQLFYLLKQRRHARGASVKVGHTAHFSLIRLKKHLDITLAATDARKLKTRNLHLTSRFPCNMLGGTQRAYLRGVERTSARTVNAKGTCRFARHVKALDIALPVAVHRHTAVTVLSANGDLQTFGIQIDAVIGIQLDSPHVHFSQPFYGCAEQRTRPFKIGICFLRKHVKAILKTLRIFCKIKIYPVSLLDLLGNKNIHRR